jgi:hypothetical protein
VIEGVKNEMSTATEEVKNLGKGMHEIKVKAVEYVAQHESIADSNFQKIVLILEDNTGAIAKDEFLLPADTSIKKHAKLGMRAVIPGNLILMALGFTITDADSTLKAWNYLLNDKPTQENVETIIGARYSIVIDFEGRHAEWIKGTGNEKAKFIICEQDGTQMEESPEFPSRDELKAYAKERSLDLKDFSRIVRRFPSDTLNNWDCELPQTPKV